MKIVLLGPNGSGKGTLAKLITQDFAIPHISIGDLFRDAIAKKDDLGLQAQVFMNKGVLVPDKLTIKILQQRLKQPDCQKGFVLDGFPRSLSQAKAFAKITEIDTVICVDVPLEECTKRLSARRICTSCGQIDSTLYDGFSGNCRKCGAKLFQRDDDKPEAIKVRLEVYEKQTTPLINFYSDRLFKVSNVGKPQDAYKSVKTFLKKLEKKKWKNSIPLK